MAEFFKGKKIRLIVSSRSGSSADLVGRIIAPILGKEIGAKIIIKNMAAAAGMEGLNFLATKAKPNGLTIGLRDSASTYLNQLMKTPGAQWDIAKLIYLGVIQPTTMVFYVSPGGPIKNIEDLKNAKKLKLGSPSPRGWMTNVLAGTSKLLGLDAKIISGFKGSAGTALAVSKGEIHGSAVGGYTLKRYDRKGQARPLFSTAGKRDLEYPNLPAITEFVDVSKDPVASFMAGLRSGRLLMLPQGTPPDRVEFLRNAVWKVINTEPFKSKFMKGIGTKNWGENIPGPEFAKEAEKMVANKALGEKLLAIFERYRP
jgi:tripartite-type tricarboxylate transporter receptor subunit TctC